MLIDEIIRDSVNSRADRFNEDKANTFKLTQPAVEKLIDELKLKIVEGFLADISDGHMTVLAYKNKRKTKPVETFITPVQLRDPETHSNELKGARGTTKANMGNIDDFYEAWSQLPDPIKGRKGAKTRSITNKFRTRMEEEFFRENWKEALQAMSVDPHCLGVNEMNWVADKAYFLRPDTLEKLLKRSDQRKLEKPKSVIPNEFR